MPDTPAAPQPHQWTPMRIWTLAVATILTLILIIGVASSVYYTGNSESNVYFVLVAKAAAVCWVGHIAAHVRDVSIAHQRIILARLAEIEERLDDYGDRREIAGQMVAARVNGSGQKARLIPIE